MWILFKSIMIILNLKWSSEMDNFSFSKKCRYCTNHILFLNSGYGKTRRRKEEKTNVSPAPPPPALPHRIPFEGSDRLNMVAELRVQNFSRVYIFTVYKLYLFSKSANSIFKILLDWPEAWFWKKWYILFYELFNSNDKNVFFYILLWK